jgi:adenosine deaminase CECR1
MSMHPLPILLNNGIPVVLCSDDPAVFGNMGLTYDLFQVSILPFRTVSMSLTVCCQVLIASEVRGLIALGEMARDSLEVSRLLLHG